MATNVDFDFLGSYYPINRSDKYPRSLLADFSRLKPNSLKRYLKAHGLTVRPDSTVPELAVAVARHFDSRTKVDEEGSVIRFMNAVRKSTGAEESAKIKRRARAKELRDREIAEAEAARVVRTSKRGEAAVGYAPAHYQHHQQAKDDEDEEDTGEDSENVETFCICKRPSYGEMVACDNTSCGIEWFHIGCVGLSSVPAQSESWYCEDCRPSESEDDERGRRAKGSARAMQLKKRRGASTGNAGRSAGKSARRAGDRDW